MGALYRLRIPTREITRKNLLNVVIIGASGALICYIMSLGELVIMIFTPPKHAGDIER